MSRDSSGTYTAPTNSFNPAVEGTEINQDDFNALLTDVEAALTDSLDRTGKGKVTAHVDFDEISAPSSPSANVGRLYVADNGSGTTKAYFKDSAGTVSDLTAGAGILAFKTISVSGQSDVVADSAADTLTLAAGSNVTITTDATTDTVTISASGGGGGSGSPSIPQGRLTLTSGTPVTMTDVTAATTIYYTPYQHNNIALYNGSTWDILTFTEKSASLAGLAADLPHDVFGYNNASTLAIEVLAWSNATTRATALALQDGVLVKSGAATRRYLGTFCTTSTIGQTEDSTAKRFVWNYYNRAQRHATGFYTAGRTTSSTTFVEIHSEIRTYYVLGYDEEMWKAGLIGYGSIGAAVGSLAVTEDAGTSPTLASQAFSANQLSPTEAPYKPTIGRHYASLVGKTSSAGVALSLNGSGVTPNTAIFVMLRG